MNFEVGLSSYIAECSNNDTIWHKQELHHVVVGLSMSRVRSHQKKVRSRSSKSATINLSLFQLSASRSHQIKPIRIELRRRKLNYSLKSLCHPRGLYTYDEAFREEYESNRTCLTGNLRKIVGSPSEGKGKVQLSHLGRLPGTLSLTIANGFTFFFGSYHTIKNLLLH